MKEEHYRGHRQRVRKRLVEQGLASFQDYEAMELLLLYVARQQDMKPVAKALIERFGSFKGVLDASAEELQSVDGVGLAAATLIQFVKQAAGRYLQQGSRDRFSPDSQESLIEYCILSMGAQPNESFRVICLNTSFAIVHEEDLGEGTIDQAAVYPRRVAEIALAARAKSLVFVHNHPDGNVTPSDFDKTVTKSLVLAAKTLGMSVYDHVIVSSEAHFSFRENGLL